MDLSWLISSTFYLIDKLEKQAKVNLTVADIWVGEGFVVLDSVVENLGKEPVSISSLSLNDTEPILFVSDKRDLGGRYLSRNPESSYVDLYLPDKEFERSVNKQLIPFPFSLNGRGITRGLVVFEKSDFSGTRELMLSCFVSGKKKPLTSSLAFPDSKKYAT